MKWNYMHRKSYFEEHQYSFIISHDATTCYNKKHIYTLLPQQMVEKIIIWYPSEMMT